jgi:hypothetical protein
MSNLHAAVDHEEEAPRPLHSTPGRVAAPLHPMAGRGLASASPAARYGFTPAHPSAATPRDTLDMVRALDPLQRDMDHVKELLQQLGTKERYAAQVNYPNLEREFSAVRRMVEQLV